MIYRLAVATEQRGWRKVQKWHHEITAAPFSQYRMKLHQTRVVNGYLVHHRENGGYEGQEGFKGPPLAQSARKPRVGMSLSKLENVLNFNSKPALTGNRISSLI